MRWDNYAGNLEDMRNAYKILIRKPEGKIAFGRHGHK
jgi:hypothetical protein